MADNDTSSIDDYERQQAKKILQEYTEDETETIINGKETVMPI